MDEGRKRTILIAASILVARDYAQLKGKPSPALDAAMSNAVSMAERIMRQIDSRWKAQSQPPSQSMTSMTNYPWKPRS